jgi:8-oxo-dGTP pyrophosphatase MutT (NUDIX family)
MNEASSPNPPTPEPVDGVEIVFQTPWFRVEARPAGPSAEDATRPYYVVCPPDYVSVLATTPDNEVLLVQVYRPTIGGTSWELPSGMPEPGESPEATAVRELLEETGCRGDRVAFMGQMHPDTGRMGNRMHCFRVWNAVPVPDAPPSGEVLQVRRVAPADLPAVVGGDMSIAIHAGVLALAQARGYLPAYIL